MSLTVAHDHLPIYRVVRRGWTNPLDTSFSQRTFVENRWKTPAFPALYCCCSKTVARAIARDRLGLTGVDLEDLQVDAHPQLVEIHWVGEPIDMISGAAIVAAGFSPDYPIGASRKETLQAAARWYNEGHVGILCRSASMHRSGFKNWAGDHAGWSELAIFTENSPLRPSVLSRSDDLDWLSASPA